VKKAPSRAGCSPLLKVGVYFLQAIREQILEWLEEAGLDWTALTEEEFDSVWDELEETRPLFPWEVGFGF
jgi:hypothetical protein